MLVSSTNLTNDLKSLESFALAVKQVTSPSYKPFCELKLYGSGFGKHTLCNIVEKYDTSNNSCYFMSFGIANDYSFDTDLHSKHGCIGHAFDPTVNYNETLGPGLLIYSVKPFSM